MGNILVTGGGGFIGSHLVDTLLADGHKVTALDNFRTGREENLKEALKNPSFTLHRLELTGSLKPVFAGEPFSAIYHLAAQTNVRESIRNPVYDAQNNVIGTLNLLTAATKNLSRHIVFTSSVAVYGRPASIPIDETRLMRPVTPYGMSKKICHDYLAYFQRNFGFTTCALVLSNVYGPRQNPRGEAGVVAIFTDRLSRLETPRIYGDGRQRRDFVYVGDVVEALTACLDAGRFNPDEPAVMNIGTGRETSVNDLFAALAKILEANVRPVHENNRMAEIKSISVKCDRARALIDWQPRTELETGLMSTVESYKP